MVASPGTTRAIPRIAALVGVTAAASRGDWRPGFVESSPFWWRAPIQSGISWIEYPNEFCEADNPPVEWGGMMRNQAPVDPPERAQNLMHLCLSPGTFEECAASCAAIESCSTFAFTNGSVWHHGGSMNTGCSIRKEATGCPTKFCTTGACRNWDTYVCPAGPARHCSSPPLPPAPAPPPPPPPGPFGFATPIASDMVLQRDTKARLWGGGAEPGAQVTLTAVPSSSGPTVSVSCIADPTGAWACDLPAKPGSPETYTITATSTSPVGANDTIKGVLFGDVWGCHGQSNMVFGLGQDAAAATECSATAQYPFIRTLNFMSDLKTWVPASPENMCTGKGFSPFSAVCWYFGKNVFDAINRNTTRSTLVPVGLVFSAVGGTAVERWSGPEATAKCNQTGVVQQGNLWEPHIVPLLPMAVSGWTWYQGESNVACSTTWKWYPGLNCGIGCSAQQPVCNASQKACADFYSCQFPAMISDWRDKFNGGATAIFGRPPGPRPFLFVELAPYTEGVGEPFDQSVALVREAQLAALALPAVGMAAAYDYGDPKSPLGNIHPEFKAPVGARLALAARALAYGENVVFRNPRAILATRLAASGEFKLQFDVPVVIKSPVRGSCPVEPYSCAWMSVAGMNATCKDVSAFGNSIVCSVHGAIHPGDSVWYLQGDWPIPFLYAAHTVSVPEFPGLPVVPFKLILQ